MVSSTLCPFAVASGFGDRALNAALSFSLKHDENSFFCQFTSLPAFGPWSFYNQWESALCRGFGGSIFFNPSLLLYTTTQVSGKMAAETRRLSTSL
jgi:hypothetical protein